MQGCHEPKGSHRHYGVRSGLMSSTRVRVPFLSNTPKKESFSLSEIPPSPPLTGPVLSYRNRVLQGLLQGSDHRATSLPFPVLWRCHRPCTDIFPRVRDRHTVYKLFWMLEVCFQAVNQAIISSFGSRTIPASTASCIVVYVSYSQQSGNCPSGPIVYPCPWRTISFEEALARHFDPVFLMLQPQSTSQWHVWNTMSSGLT